MTDKYKDLRDAARRRSLFCHPDVISAYRAYSTPEVILSLLADHDALLKAQAEKDAEINSLRHELNSVQFKLRGMDMRPQAPIARAALAQHQGEKHDTNTGI